MSLMHVSIDILCLIFTALELSQLVHLKRVCTEWANAVRRCVYNVEWRHVPRNLASITYVPMRYARYESAHDAFASLNGCAVLDRRRISRVCRAIGTVYNNWQMSAHRLTGAEDLLHCVFKNSELRIFDKSIRVLQQAASDRICIFSDVYGVNTDVLNDFASRCTRFGLELYVFEKRYPALEFTSGYYASREVKTIDFGYKQFYRGKIVGCMVGEIPK